MTTFSQPRSIISQINSPILATLMAPEKVPTTAHSGSRTIWVRTSAASPRLRPPNAVLPMAARSSSKSWTLVDIQGLQGSQTVLGPVVKIFVFATHFRILFSVFCFRLGFRLFRFQSINKGSSIGCNVS